MASDDAVQQAYDALAKFDEELDNVDEELRKATARVTFQFEKQRQAIYKRRAEVARSIPQFWPIALQNHPDLAGLLTVDDVQALSYLVDFECEPTGETQLEGLKITFTFKPNPYFENEKLIKEYAVTSEDGLTVKSQTKIQWKNGQDLTAKKATVGGAGTKRKAHDVDETSFFSYFESDNADLNQSMAQILFEDFWRRAFDYHQGVEQDFGDEELAAAEELDEEEEDDDGDDDGQD